MAIEQTAPTVGLSCTEALQDSPVSTRAAGLALDIASSPTLRRLIEEVRIEGEAGGDAPLNNTHNRYDRTHNRHNR